MMPAGLIVPEWPVPGRVRSMVTTREFGDVKDRSVRERLREMLPGEPVWLRQVHGVRVVEADDSQRDAEADAAFTRERGRVLAIMTADCLPVLFCSRDASVIAAAHAGWRGLQAGVLENTVDSLDVDPATVVAYLGPGIGPSSYEVGEEVRDAFVSRDPEAAKAFAASRAGHYMADLYALARQRLAKAGIMSIFGGGFCTLKDSRRFFSYRRDATSGRMASLIWLEPN
jgi:YfiH family protein